jgi:hypothetical protein
MAVRDAGSAQEDAGFEYGKRMGEMLCLRPSHVGTAAVARRPQQPIGAGKKAWSSGACNGKDNYGLLAALWAAVRLQLLFRLPIVLSES